MGDYWGLCGGVRCVHFFPFMDEIVEKYGQGIIITE